MFFNEELSLNDVQQIKGMLQDASWMGVAFTEIGYAANDQMRQWRTDKIYIQKTQLLMYILLSYISIYS